MQLSTARGARMLSKCANPECFEKFLYLGQGKLFHLIPTPDVLSCNEDAASQVQERFWLCDRCAKEMTVIWAGSGPKIVRKRAAEMAATRRVEKDPSQQARSRAVAVGREEG